MSLATIVSGLPNFIDEMNRSIDRANDEATVLATRALLARYILEPRFVIDCIAAVLGRIESIGHWDSAPIHRDPQRAYLVRILYWPAGYRNLPHEHLTWTVAAVFHGCLNVQLWKPDSAFGMPSEVYRSVAVCAGDVGYLQPPCIHSFENSGADTGVSLHVIATNESASNQQDHVKWFGRGNRSSLPATSGWRRNVLTANVATLEACGSAAVPALQRCFDLGDHIVKLAAARAVVRLAPAPGRELVTRLASQCAPSDHVRLLDIAGRLSVPGG